MLFTKKRIILSNLPPTKRKFAFSKVVSSSLATKFDFNTFKKYRAKKYKKKCKKMYFISYGDSKSKRLLFLVCFLTHLSSLYLQH